MILLTLCLRSSHEYLILLESEDSQAHQVVTQVSPSMLTIGHRVVSIF